MSELRIGINGFGRIGRLVFRAAMKNNTRIMGVNDPFITVDYASYLLRYDSVHGQFDADIHVDSDHNTLIVNGQTVPFFSEKEAGRIPWGSCGAEFIAETSGVYLSQEKCQQHLNAGARKVVMSAPPKDAGTPLFVMGVNHRLYDPSTMHIVSNASCTTNCLAPLAKIVNDSFGIEEGLMTTIHAVTATQHTVDAPSGKDWRSGRCAGMNIIPASTGAAKSVGKVIPQLEGKLTGMAFRVPTPDVSVVDLTVKLSRPISSLREISEAIERLSSAPITPSLPTTSTTTSSSSSSSESQGTTTPTPTTPMLMGGIIGVTRDAVVSMDFKGDPRSCIFDESASIMLNPRFVKLVAYYDNEWAYSMRMVDLLQHMKCCE